MQTVTIDLIPQDELPVIKVSQYNDNWDIRFIITENGEEIQVHPDDVVTCVIRKPDNNIVTIDANVPYYGNGVIVSLTEQACACYGKALGELKIEIVTGGINRRVGSCNFILDVEISPEYGGIVSASEINNLQRQIDAIITRDAGPIVADVAEPIVRELVPEVIGDNYYTKAQIDSAYYSKTQVDNLLTQLAATIPHKITGTLAAGATSITLVDTSTVNPLNDNSLVSLFTPYNVIPTGVSVDAATHSITLTFEDHDSDINVAVTIL